MILLSTVGLKTRFLQSFQRARWFSLPSGIKNKIPTDSQLIHWMSAVAITSWLCVKLKNSLHFIFIFHTDRTLWVNDGHLVNFHQICSNSAEKGLAPVVSEDRLFFMFVLKVLKDLSLHSRTNSQWSICRCLKTKFPRSGSFEPNDLKIVTGKRVVFSDIILEQPRAHMQFKMLPSERGRNRIKFYRFNQCDNLSALW